MVVITRLLSSHTGTPGAVTPAAVKVGCRPCPAATRRGTGGHSRNGQPKRTSRPRSQRRSSTGPAAVGGPTAVQAVLAAPSVHRAQRVDVRHRGRTQGHVADLGPFRCAQHGAKIPDFWAIRKSRRPLVPTLLR